MLEERDFPVIPGELMPPEVAHELQMQINRLLNKRGMNFPGSQPVSFEGASLAVLREHDYFVCEKSDGLRCLMLCILDPNGEEAVFLITREYQIYRVPGFHFPVPEGENLCHNGTIIDGELVISKRPDGEKELRYLMFDCLCMNGKAITTKPLDKRLGYLDMVFFRPYFKLRQNHPRECESFPFKLSLKNMQPSYKLPKVFENIKNLGHISDGLIFTCLETPYVFGTDNTLLKWKPAEENTVDFRLHLNIPLFVDEDLDDRDPDKSYPNYEVKPGLELHVWHGDNAGESKYTYFGELTCQDDEWEKLKALDEPLEERIVECHKDLERNWKILRFRDDKANGNHVGVVTKVLQSIKDAVTKEQLCEEAQEIEHAWKARHSQRRNGSHDHQHQPHHPHPQAPPPQPQMQQQKRPQEDDLPTYEEDSEDEDEQVSKKQRTE